MNCRTFSQNPRTQGKSHHHHHQQQQQHRYVHLRTGKDLLFVADVPKKARNTILRPTSVSNGLETFHSSGFSAEEAFISVCEVPYRGIWTQSAFISTWPKKKKKKIDNNIAEEVRTLKSKTFKSRNEKLGQKLRQTLSVYNLFC